MVFIDDWNEYCQNSNILTHGNPWVEIGTARTMAALLGKQSGYFNHYSSLEERLYNSDTGFYVKKLSGDTQVSDEISHDDLIGIASRSCLYAAKICVDAKKYFGVWVYTNTGKIYWDAIIKPWHKAYYIELAFGPTRVRWLWLAGAILMDALFNKDNMSNKILIWMMAANSKNKHRLLDRAISFWEERTGNMAQVFLSYYNNDPAHIFVKWARIIVLLSDR